MTLRNSNHTKVKYKRADASFTSLCSIFPPVVARLIGAYARHAHNAATLSTERSTVPCSALIESVA
jgi:hypothetical protein